MGKFEVDGNFEVLNLMKLGKIKIILMNFRVIFKAWTTERREFLSLNIYKELLDPG